MCNFASFCVGKLTSLSAPLKIYVGDYWSHGGIDGGHELNPGDTREAEWIEDAPEFLSVRVEDGEDESFYRAAVLAKYPTRSALFADNRSGKVGSPKGVIKFNKDGQRDGLYESWCDNGQLSCRATYKDGKEI